MLLSKQERVNKLETLIGEGQSLVMHESYEQHDYSYDPFSASKPQIVYFTTVNSDLYPSWRMESLANLKNFLGNHSTYVKEFEHNCGSNSTEHNLKQGIGILNAVKKGYTDGSILEEKPPVFEKKDTLFQIIQVNENKNNVAVKYNVSNFNVLIESIEKSDEENKEEIVREIRKIQEEIEKGNPNWETIKKWTIFALGLGKDLGINLLANIIAKSAHIG